MILEQGFGSMLINFPLNAAIAWLGFRSLTEVPLWGAQSIAGDLVVTAFLLPFITCLIVTPLTHRGMRSGRLPVASRARGAHPILARLPSGTPGRALAIGLAFTALVSPVALWALGTLGSDPMAFRDFLVFKASFAAGLGVLAGPLIALCALGDAGEDPDSGAGSGR